MGHDYKGGSETFRCISENLKALVEAFPYFDGYFGKKGDSSSSQVRNIASNDPLGMAKSFYDLAAYGGYEEELGSGKWKTTMEDGTVFTMREVSGSSDNSPAVDINVLRSTNNGGVKKQKIHFVLKGESE